MKKIVTIHECVIGVVSILKQNELTLILRKFAKP